MAPSYAGTLKLKWEDLEPKFKPLRDPLAKLKIELRYGLHTIIWVRTLSKKQRNNLANLPILKEARQYEKDFQNAKLDVNKIIAAYVKRRKELQRRQNITVSSLNNKKVQLGGYLLVVQ